MRVAKLGEQRGLEPSQHSTESSQRPTRAMSTPSSPLRELNVEASVIKRRPRVDKRDGGAGRRRRRGNARVLDDSDDDDDDFGTSSEEEEDDDALVLGRRGRGRRVGRALESDDDDATESDDDDTMDDDEMFSDETLSEDDASSVGESPALGSRLNADSTQRSETNACADDDKHAAGGVNALRSSSTRKETLTPRRRYEEKEPDVPVPKDIGVDADRTAANTLAVDKPLRLKGKPGGPKFELHASLAGRLYDHQRDGVRWMWGLQLVGRGGILADDMGLGKTLQAAAFATGLLRSGAAKRVLILAPTTLLPHWAKEFEKCGLKHGQTLFKYYAGTPSERQRQLKACTTGRGVLLTSYGMVTSRATELGAPADEDLAETMAQREGRGSAPRDFAGAFRWDWIIMDEGHKLKSTTTQVAQKVRQIPANLRMIVTGTPIQNDLGELWSLYDLTCPGLLGGENEFRRRFVHKITAGQASSATQKQRAEAKDLGAELRKTCAPFFLRREKSEVLAKKPEEEKDDDVDPVKPAAAPNPKLKKSSWKNVSHAPQALGQKNDLIAWIPLEKAQSALYTKFLASKPVRDAVNKRGSAISCMNTLKKICDHPALCCVAQQDEDDDETHVENMEEMEEEQTAEQKKSCAGEAAAAAASAVRECGFDANALESGDASVSSKLRFLMSMLDRFQAEGHRTLVFSQSQAMLDIIEKNVRASDKLFVRIDGKVNVEERDRRVSRFRQNDDIPVMLLTSRVGGLGLTLTEATRVIIYDPAWNPTTDNQSVDRAYRIGQTKDVVVYRLITCGTVEEKIYRRQVFKGGLSKAGAEGGNSTRYFGDEDPSQLFETSEKALSASETMKQLNALHAADRKWTDELQLELPFVSALDCVCGVSDHDLLFSKDDESAGGAKAKPASGKQPQAGGSTPKGKGPGGAAWKNVNSGWGGDGGLLGGSVLAVITPKKNQPPAMDSDESPEQVSGEAKLKAKIDALRADIDKQGVILSMPDVVAKIPDKGESIRKAIETKEAEKRVLEAEFAAKYVKATSTQPAETDDADVFYTPAGSPDSQTPQLETVISLTKSIDLSSL